MNYVTEKSKRKAVVALLLAVGAAIAIFAVGSITPDLSKWRD